MGTDERRRLDAHTVAHERLRGISLASGRSPALRYLVSIVVLAAVNAALIPLVPPIQRPWLVAVALALQVAVVVVLLRAWRNTMPSRLQVGSGGVRYSGRGTSWSLGWHHVREVWIGGKVGHDEWVEIVSPYGSHVITAVFELPPLEIGQIILTWATTQNPSRPNQRMDQSSAYAAKEVVD